MQPPGLASPGSTIAGEPSHNLEAQSAQQCSQLPPCPHRHPHCPTAWHGVAGSDPWPGVTHAQGCAWARWLISPWPQAGGPPAQAATRERREALEPRQTGSATWSIGLSWDGSVLGGKGGGDHSWREDIPPSWRGKIGRGSASGGPITEFSGLRNLGTL